MFAQAGLRDLPVAYVVDGKGTVKVAVLEDEKIPYVAPPEHLLRAADGGQVPLLMPRDTFRVAAITKLHNYPRLLPLRRARRRSHRSCGTCGRPKTACSATRACGRCAAASSSRTA